MFYPKNSINNEIINLDLAKFYSTALSKYSPCERQSGHANTKHEKLIETRQFEESLGSAANFMTYSLNFHN